jgi:hypothetical protein
MEDNRLPKQLLDYHSKGRRRLGRPRKRLLDDVNIMMNFGCEERVGRKKLYL